MESFAHCPSFGYNRSMPSLGTPGGPTKPQHCRILGNKSIPVQLVNTEIYPVLPWLNRCMPINKMPQETHKSTPTNKTPGGGWPSSLDKPVHVLNFDHANGKLTRDPWWPQRFCFHCYHCHIWFSHIPSYLKYPSLSVISPARATTSGSSRKLSASSPRCSTVDGPVELASRQGGQGVLNGVVNHWLRQNPAAASPKASIFLECVPAPPTYPLILETIW